MVDLCWRVGMSTRISICNHDWAAGSPDYHLSSSINNSNLVVVTDIIDSSTREWKREEILIPLVLLMMRG